MKYITEKWEGSHVYFSIEKEGCSIVLDQVVEWRSRVYVFVPNE